MEAYALDAIDHAKSSMRIDLDFSPDSVKEVESILDVMFKTRPAGIVAKLLKRGPSPEAVDTFSKAYGGYIGEVLRKLGGGEWFFDTQIAPGQRVIGLQKSNQRLWPTAKVGKRLTNGPEDNVWHYFQIIREKW